MKWLNNMMNGNGKPSGNFDIERLQQLKHSSYICETKRTLLANLKRQLGLPQSHSFVLGK